MAERKFLITVSAKKADFKLQTEDVHKQKLWW